MFIIMYTCVLVVVFSIVNEVHRVTEVLQGTMFCHWKKTELQWGGRKQSSEQS